MSQLSAVNVEELLVRLVETPSLSGQEDAAVELVLQFAHARGMDVTKVGRNAVITVGPPSPRLRRKGAPGGRRLLLNSHLDTVPPAAGWETDPWTVKQDGDRLIGLGANDAKGSVASMLTAAAQLHDEGWRDGQIVLALTVQEETGGEGLERIVDGLGPLDAAVIGEPTSLQVCRAQKGLVILKVTTRGDARHAAHAHLLPGDDAIRLAARAIERLPAIPPFPEHELLGPTTCQVTKVRGGERHNVIADRCEFVLDVRTVPAASTEQLVAWVEKETGGEVRIHSDRLKFFETKAGEPIVDAALRATGNTQSIGSATLSDAVWTRHLPTVKVGPGDTCRSHTAGEYVTRSELLAGCAAYEALIREFFARVAGPNDE